MPPRKSSEPRCVWTAQDDAAMVEVLKEQKNLGNQSGAGWKSQVWTMVETALLKVSQGKGSSKTAAKCSDHWSSLKKQFLAVHALRNASGFGWDEGSNMVTASDSVWDTYLKAHPASKKWKCTSFPLYDDMHFLVNGIVATGDSAFHPGQSVPPSSPAPYLSSPAPAGPLPSDDVFKEAPVPVRSSSLQPAGDEETSPPKALSTPTRSKKRERAETESPSGPLASSSVSRSLKRPRKGRRHSSQADSISQVGEAMAQIASALTSGSDLATPARRKKALALVYEDAEYSSAEEDEIINLFLEDMPVADTYASIPKKSKRVKFIRNRLAKIKSVDFE
ncbi:hypothetical protein D9613_006439 [Agrocybe pediades]|uniref:Myb-like domain-containing protein n=1 Tax=Agrocybe pediades TaxID=84607 RepID=A0A8H4QV05_9AGAR|nr:hypothetical protein D9613_006439 [Agrocybe pediades]